MASALTASMLAAFVARSDVHLIFELTLPNETGGETTYKFAHIDDPVASDGGGMYLPTIQQVGEVWLQLGFPSFGVHEPRIDITVNDQTGTLQKAHGGPAAGRIRGATAKAYLISSMAPWADRYPVMDGIVKDWEPPAPRKYKYTIGPDDTPFAKNALAIPELVDEFPAIPDKNVGKPGRFLLGRWLSPGVPNATGMVEAHLIDPENGIWYAAHSALSSVPTVWVKASGSDEFATDTANWTLLTTYSTGLRNVSVLQDTASTLRTEDDVVYFDAIGPTLNWDGTGGAYNAPFQFAFDLLANFAWNEWPKGRGALTKFDETGAASGNASPLDPSGFALADTVLGYGGVTGSMIVTGRATGQQMLETCAKSFRVPIGWNDAFKLTAQPIDLGQRGYPTVSARYDKMADDDVFKIKGPKTLGDNERSRVEISYLKNDAAGTLVRKHVAADASSPRRVSDAFNMEYGPAEAL